MSFLKRMLFAALIMWGTAAWGAPGKNVPNIGYLYPGGGQQGTVIHIVAAGQFLRGATDVYISGQGVKASVVKYCKPTIFIKETKHCT